MPAEPGLAGLPGDAMMRAGLDDFRAGRTTTPAWVVATAQTRLRRAGMLPVDGPYWPEPELQLYRRLRQEGGDAYARYNALLRELASFLTALDRRRRATQS